MAVLLRGFIIKHKLLTFPSVPKEQRLKKRAEIVARHFRHPDVGTGLMRYIVNEMYDTFLETEDKDFVELNIISKLHELDAYLAFYSQEKDE